MLDHGAAHDNPLTGNHRCAGPDGGGKLRGIACIEDPLLMVKILNSNQSDNSTADAGALYMFTGLSVSDGFTINTGHSGAWFNPDTSGQG